MQHRTLTVKGTAEVSASPDWVSIGFDVTSRNYEYARCMEQLAHRTESLRNELEALGLPRESLKTSDFRIDTQFEWNKQTRVFKGYEASHRMSVGFAWDKDYLNKVLAALGKTESEASFNISFTVKDPEPLRHQALAGAVKNAREKAELLANAAGVSLGEIVTIDYSWAELYVQSRLHLDMAAASPAPSYDIQPDDVDVSDSVTVVWSIAG